MKKMKLEEICGQSSMPICIQQAPVIIKNKIDSNIYFIKMPNLQTSKHRFRTYPKPISKIISL
jgi:hypothetical protein